MKKTLFNTGWTVMPGVLNPFGAIFGFNPPIKEVTIPHDPMIEEERDPECLGGGQTAFYPSKTYTYEKKFFVPDEWRKKSSVLEFEGVMVQAMVYLNGELITTNRSGYIQFFVPLDRYLRYGEENTLQVISRSTEGISRWYPGAGIYRDVWLLQGDRCHIVPEGVRLVTDSLEDGYARIIADIAVENASLDAADIEAVLTIKSPDGRKTTCANRISLIPGEKNSTHMNLFVKDPCLWSPDEPNLCDVTVQLTRGEEVLDETCFRYGIRTLTVDSRHGLRINGTTFKMRGACIHHDNGIIGAATLPDAEEFRLRNLKAAGFNAIRSAHHPAAKALLRLCDELGILVMDEVADMWEQPKNNQDYTFDLATECDDLIRRMVSKDQNHASVVLYSLGNEIPEIGQRGGRRRARNMANLFRSLDPTRFVTCAFNGFLALSDHMDELKSIILGEEEPAKESAEEEGKESAGSEALNQALSNTKRDRMDRYAVSEMLSSQLLEISSELDVVGYNYLTARHEYDHIDHPDWVVVGSETFPTEIGRLWNICRANDHVIGDFTWTGYEYLGEAGIGIFHYAPDHPGQGWYPDRLAYCGDINLNGYRRPMSYLREVAFGLRKEPFIAVDRVDRYGQPDNTSDWKYYDCLDSWTYPGLEGHPTMIRVHSVSEEVELFLNGRSLGRKPCGEKMEFEAAFAADYEPGTLMAIGYTGGQEDGRCILETAGQASDLAVSVTKDEIKADGRGLSFVIVDLVDAEGRANHWEKKKVRFEIEGPGVLAGIGSADPSSDTSFQDPEWETYDGRVMAAIRTTCEIGEITVRVSTEGLPGKTVRVRAV